MAKKKTTKRLTLKKFELTAKDRAIDKKQPMAESNPLEIARDRKAMNQMAKNMLHKKLKGGM